jgi:mono/diheme cytochrome c family protein
MKPLTLAILSAGLLLAGVPEGKELYTAKCAPCHGPNGEGKAAIAKMFNVTLPALASKDVQSKSDADLKKVITTGKGKMKPVAGITDSQASDVVAYIRTLK